MQSHTKNKDHKSNNLQIASLKFLRKAFLLTFLLGLFFFSVPDHIKAQIASIISEDGDGIAGITSLMNATINDDVQAVKFFAKSGASVVNQKNVGGASALHIAARRGNSEICEILIENGADIDSSDNEGWTPLMRATLAKKPDLVRMLIDQGADPKKMNSIGETVIVNSASSRCSSCLEQILSNYNFIDNLDIDILNKQLEDAMVIASNKNDLQTQLIIKEYLDSEVNEDQIYSSDENLFPEDTAVPNDNVDDIVTVESLNDAPSSLEDDMASNPEESSVPNDNVKNDIIIVESLNNIPSAEGNKDNDESVNEYKSQFLPPIPKKIPGKINTKIADKVYILKPTITSDNKIIPISKKFIFKVGKKPRITPTINAQQPQPESLEVKHYKFKTIIDSSNNVNRVINHDSLMNKVIPSLKESNIHQRAGVKYKFISKKNPFVPTKTTIQLPAK